MAAERRTEIQWLRAVAACEVVVCHSDLLTKHFSNFAIAQSAYRPFSALGVELFFIVSGYVICMKVRPADGAWSFFSSRIRRLYPLYTAFTTLAVLAFVINPDWHLNRFEMDAVSLAKSYLILPQMNFPVLGVGWTLEHEMIFYLFVAIMLLTMGGDRPAKRSLAWLLAALGAIGIVFGGVPSPWIAGAPGAGGSALASHVMSPFMFAFGFGWLVRVIEGMSPRDKFLNALPFALLFAGAWWFAPAWGHMPATRLAITAAVFCGFLACRHVFADNTLNRFVWKLGDASFSIYLSHWFVLSACGKLLGHLDAPLWLDVPVRIAGIALAVAIGLAVFLLVERPLDRRLRGRGGGATVAHAPPMAVGIEMPAAGHAGPTERF